MQQNKQGGACFNLTKSVRIRLQTKNRRYNLSPLHIHLSHVSHRVLLHFTQSHPILLTPSHNSHLISLHLYPKPPTCATMRVPPRPWNAPLISPHLPPGACLYHVSAVVRRPPPAAPEECVRTVVHERSQPRCAAALRSERRDRCGFSRWGRGAARTTVPVHCRETKHASTDRADPAPNRQ
jgi:hypothetical protein